MQRYVESEFESAITQVKAEKLLDFLNQNGILVISDKQQIHTFFYQNKKVKLINHVSHLGAKVVQEYTEGKKGYIPLEVEINPVQINDMIEIFSGMPFEDYSLSQQNKSTYLYGSLKIGLTQFEDETSRNIQVEVIINSKHDAEKTLADLESLNQELKMQLLSVDEIKEFYNQV
jgi:adenylate cyclase class IV